MVNIDMWEVVHDQGIRPGKLSARDLSAFVGTSHQDRVKLFGKAPESYGYDRGGHRKTVLASLRRLGVKNVGVAPRGKAQWEVSGKVKQQLISERARIEGSIGTIKGRKYGFNRPSARKVATMGACGQRAMLGLNLNSLTRAIAREEKIVLEC